MNNSPNFEKPVLLPDIPFLSDRGKLNPQTRGRLDAIRDEMKQAADTHVVAESRLAAEKRNMDRQKGEIHQLKQQLWEAQSLVEVRKKELNAKRAEMSPLLSSTNIDIRTNAENGLTVLVDAQKEAEAIVRRIQSDIRRKETILAPLLKLEGEKSAAQQKYLALHNSYITVSSQALAEFARSTHAIETISLNAKQESLNEQLTKYNSDLAVLKRHKSEAELAVRSAWQQLANEETRLAAELGSTSLEIRQNANRNLEGARASLQAANRTLRSIEAQIRLKQVPVARIQSEITALWSQRLSQDQQLSARTTPRRSPTPAATVTPRSENAPLSASVTPTAPTPEKWETFSASSGITIAKNIKPEIVHQAVQKYRQEKWFSSEFLLTASRLRQDLGLPDGSTLTIGKRVVARINSSLDA